MRCNFNFKLLSYHCPLKIPRGAAEQPSMRGIRGNASIVLDQLHHPPTLVRFLPQLFNIFANCLQRPLALGQQHFRILTHEERSHINLELKKKNFRRFVLLAPNDFLSAQGTLTLSTPGCSNTAACQSH